MSTFNVTNGVNAFAKSLIAKKEYPFTKEEKKSKIENIIKEVLRIAQREGTLSATPTCEGKDLIYRFRSDISDRATCIKIYRLCPKVKGKRFVFQWEEYLCAGKLRYENATYVITSTIFPNGEGWKCISTAEKLNQLIINLCSLLNGNRFEQIILEKEPVMDIEYFDSWEAEKVIYRTQIYPFCLAYMQKLIPFQGEVLELCGGDGEFAKLLFDDKEVNKNIKRYTLIELNAKSAGIAENQLKKQILDNRVSIVNEDVAKANYEKLFNDRQVDLILGIGALNEQVLSSKQIVLQALEKSVERLKVGGFIFLKGLTSSWILSEDLEKQNLQVINCISPKFFQDKDVMPEFYLAQKVEYSQKIIPLWNQFFCAEMKIKERKIYFFGPGSH